MDAYSYRRYLSAKKTVDDRALNRYVVDRLRRELSSFCSRAEAPARVLEIGGGLGTMVARLVDWNVLSDADYLLLDVDADLLAGAREWLQSWAAAGGRTVESRADSLRIVSPGSDVRVSFVRAELGAYLEDEGPAPGADLLIANAFLDLVDVPNVLPRLFRRVAPGGLFWFPINYDGDTIFQPDHADDATLLEVYDRSMDQRVRYGKPAGDSKTGRHLFGHIAAAGGAILAAGASDWVVHGQNGAYEADEAYFLRFIVHTIDQELKQHPEVDPLALARWVDLRARQIDRGELVYVAHQLDFAGWREPSIAR